MFQPLMRFAWLCTTLCILALGSKVYALDPKSFDQRIKDMRRQHLEKVLREQEEERLRKEQDKLKYVYDFSTYLDIPNTTPVSTDICQKVNSTDNKADAITRTGDSVKMVGAALVYFSPTSGRAVMGHIAERFIYCRNNELIDVLYDYGPLGAERLNEDFERDFKVSLKSMTSAQQSNLTGSLFIDAVRNPRPHYRYGQLEQNRSIYEAWIEADGQTLFKMLSANLLRYQEQLNLLRTGKPLPPYKVLANNCMTHLKTDMEIANPGYLRKNMPEQLTPIFFFERTVRHASNVIVYPSQHDFRLLNLEQQGRSIVRERFTPAATLPEINFANSWILLQPETKSRWAFFFMSPIAGVVNTLTAIAETAYGVITLPLNFIGSRVPFLRFLFSDRNGMTRIKSGMRDIYSSLSEVLWLRLRYPGNTAWNEDEKAKISELAQQSMLLDYINNKSAQLQSELPLSISGLSALYEVNASAGSALQADWLDLNAPDAIPDERPVRSLRK